MVPVVMKMNAKLIPTALAAAGAVLLLQAILPTRSNAAGPLDPPDGAPAPTMVSLGELSEQITALQQRVDSQLPGGKNLAYASSNGWVSVWDHETKEWSRFQLGGVIGPLTESQGNFLFISNVGSAAAWSQETKTWKAVNFSNTHISSSGGSNGNFYVTTQNSQVAAWNKKTGEWATTSLNGLLGGRASSEGNFLFVSKQGRAAVWDQDTGTWTTETTGAFIIPIGSDSTDEDTPGS